MADKKTRKNIGKAMIPAKYYQIFALKLTGYKYDAIAKMTGYTEDWLRHLFCKGGALYEVWRGWAETAKGEFEEEVMDMAFANLPDIMRRRILHARGMVEDDPGAVLSSKIILDYTLGKPEKRMRNKDSNSDINFTSFADWIKYMTEKKEEEENNNDSAQMVNGKNTSLPK